MEHLFFAGKAYLKISSLVKTPLHEFMAVEPPGYELLVYITATFWLKQAY